MLELCRIYFNRVALFCIRIANEREIGIKEMEYDSLEAPESVAFTLSTVIYRYQRYTDIGVSPKLAEIIK